MRIKRFRGENALEVLAQVKRELGEEALILSSRRVEEGGKFWYEITAAVDRDPAPEVPEAGSLSMESPSPETLQEIRNELSEIKGLLQEAFSEKVARSRYVKWLEMGIPPEVASEMEDPVSWIRERLARKGTSTLSRNLIFVGPAGAGRTSAVFKVATWFKYRQGQEVTVVTLNRHRVGARAEAMRLGELLEIPVLTELPNDLSQDGCLLVDTPAWGWNFGPEELEDLLEKFPRARIQAVLKAVEHPQSLKRFLKEIENYPVEGLVLTQVDRLVSGLPLVFLLKDEWPVVSFISSGPRVPEDLTRATPEVLERIFIRGLKAVYDLK